jgi:hypothetical protein
MTSDLLFSILPREGKVPIAHDSQKVVQIDKQEPLKALTDEEKELKGEEREARQKQQQENEKQQEEKPAEQSEQVASDENTDETKKPKGPKHLDIYV